MNSWPWTICMFVFFAIFHYNGCLGCLEEERVALWKIKASTKWNSTDCLRTDNEYPTPDFCTWVDDKTSDCCTWESVKCSNSTGRVIQLSLAGTYNSEEYNQFLERLLDVSLYTPFEELQHLDLSDNLLNWEIEDLERLSKLKKLEVLDLGHNQFVNKSNTIPFLSKTNWEIEDLERLSKLKKLEVLDLGYNRFVNKSNTVPFLGELKSLKTLILTWNNLAGSLSDFAKVLTNLNNLEFLDLTFNYLYDFPDLRNMSNLKILDLSGNNFSGKMPESLAMISNLSALILSNNRLDGQISPNLFNNISLCTLRLNGNQFTGIIPNPTLPEFSSLQILDLSRNLISGEIPTWIGNLTWLRTLVLRNNSFDGPIPLEFCNLVHLVFLDLSQNYLSGPIPSCLNLTSLQYMHLQGNNLTGLMPEALLKSPNLKTLNLKHNNLSGSIPSWLALLSNLRIILLKGNHLSGSIPHEFCQLNKILILDLSHNAFIGPIPPCFSNITFGKNGTVEPAFVDQIEISFGASVYMYPNHFERGEHLHYRDDDTLLAQYEEQEEVDFVTKSRSDSYRGDILNYMAGMDLSCNEFTGDIPPELGALIAIRALNLSNNQLTGSIPKSLSDIKQLESMDLSHNKLSGQIPSELIGMNFLAVFIVAYNNLSGRVPDKAQFSTFDVSSYEGNPSLCGLPLQKQCNTSKDSVISVTLRQAGLAEKFGIDPISFLSSFAATYVVFLLGFVIVLYVNPNWRGLWFNFIDACLSFIFPFCSK